MPTRSEQRRINIQQGKPMNEGLEPVTARYINANAVEKIIADYYDAQLLSYPQGKEKQRLLGGINFGRNVVRDAPTADVAEVKHGEWVDYLIGFCNVCSECGVIIERTAIKNHSGNLNYCPNCGTKMDGGTHNGNL